MVKIVVVDDDPIHLELVATILVRAGHDVVPVNNGNACLLKLDGKGVDLVVTDIFMPHMDGFRIMSEIRANGSGIPVIGMTGGMNGKLSVFTDIMAQLGACVVLTKPFAGADLLDAVSLACPPADK
jgi:CheY-like chemotaxis protein